MIKYSVIIPIYNEKENIPILYKKINTVMGTFNEPFEIVFVNDGSKDDSCKVLRRLSVDSAQMTVVNLARRFGKSCALQAGYDVSCGEIIITLDGDLQNDPSDIPSLLKELNEGYDVVCGWRYQRYDSWLKRSSSRFANFIRRLCLDEDIHDVGCAFRVYLRESLRHINLYGEWHRFLTVLLKKKGYRIAELRISHYPRIFGKTKYGIVKRCITSIPYFLRIIFCKDIRLSYKRRYKLKEVIKHGKSYLYEILPLNFYNASH